MKVVALVSLALLGAGALLWVRRRNVQAPQKDLEPYTPRIDTKCTKGMVLSPRGDCYWPQARYAAPLPVTQTRR